MSFSNVQKTQLLIVNHRYSRTGTGTDLSVVCTTTTLSIRAHSDSDDTARTTQGLRLAYKARQSISVGRTSTLVGTWQCLRSMICVRARHDATYMPSLQRVAKEGCTLTGREVGSGAPSFSLSSLITKARRCAKCGCCAGVPGFLSARSCGARV